MMNNYSTALAKALVVLMLVGGCTIATAQSATAYASSSGWCTPTTNFDDSILWSNAHCSGGTKRGWCSFELPSYIPNPPTLYTVVLHFFVVRDTNEPTTLVSYIPYFDPAWQAPLPYDSLRSSSRFQVWSGSVDTCSTGGPKEYIDTLPPWGSWPQNYPVSGPWTFSWLVSDEGALAVDFGEADGHAPPAGRGSDTRPYLVFYQQ